MSDPVEPPPSAPKWSPPSRSSRGVGERIELDIDVITPMFGGGFEPRNNDPDDLIRAASIRGHLRFWWRATAGAALESVDELACAETRIWGGLRNPDRPREAQHGPVSIAVRVTRRGEEVAFSALAERARPQRGPQLGYVLFPFGADNEHPQEASGRKSLRLRLQIDLPNSLREEVERALRAWLALGGVGARTRRGCGALRALDSRYLPANGELGAWLADLTPAVAGRTWPILSGGSWVMGAAESVANDHQTKAQTQWSSLATFWARFRKGHVGSKDYEPMRGCRWRDYETLTREAAGGGTIRLNKPQLGLPIIYQDFGNRKFSGSLEAGSSGRMASPVILKPLALRGDQLAPLVLVLHSPGPQTIRVGHQERRIEKLPGDPVLDDLRVQDPLDAVYSAARRHLGNGTTGGRISGRP